MIRVGVGFTQLRVSHRVKDGRVALDDLLMDLRAQVVARTQEHDGEYRHQQETDGKRGEREARTSQVHAVPKGDLARICSDPGPDF